MIAALSLLHLAPHQSRHVRDTAHALERGTMVRGHDRVQEGRRVGQILTTDEAIEQLHPASDVQWAVQVLRLLEHPPRRTRESKQKAR
jgi:hypothetical protein